MSTYLEEFQSRFMGIMQWDDCKSLLEVLINNPADWYVYDTDENQLPNATMAAQGFIDQIQHIKSVLDEQHKERYCGIVYTNDLKNPTFVKIFHPNNLGKTCGSSENPPIPKWLISKTQPEDVIEEFGPKEDEGFVSKLLKF